ncbi:MAG: serine protein kinase RIO [Candidatus Thermoplasmatota archaeon]|nr:serine protein kinase RIO [Candidatus Thermoplasmatota archaeon]
MSSDELLTDKWLKKLDRQSQEILDRVVFDRGTFGEVFDRQTILRLGKLISDKIIDQMDFPLSTGKEANLFRATTPEHEFVAMKIYRTSTMTFKHIATYIDGDPRFKSGMKNRRDIIEEWAKKEFKNLEVLRRSKVRVPAPIKRLHNILIMEYIGDANQAAPLLKDVPLKHPQKIYDELMSFIARMYAAQIVHADLSPYNILMFQHKPYIIDVGQAVHLDHPSSQEFLKRDIHNIVQYFTRYDIRGDEQHLYEKLTTKK